MSWIVREALQQRLAKEEGAQVYPPGSRHGFALVYPNTYHVGMSNLGFQIIYQQINGRGDTACERFFLPDRKDEAEYRRSNTPLLSIETRRPLYDFPLIGIDMTFELDYFHLITALKMGKVPLWAQERTDYDPIIILGGPCATFNPEPLADFIDVAVIGEGEEVIHELLDTYYQACDAGLDREAVLLQLAQVPGLYVPRFYQPAYAEDGVVTAVEPIAAVPTAVKRRWIENLDAYPAQTVIATPDTEFGGMHLIEVARGCGRHCRFCMAGYCYRQPRVRSLEALLPAIEFAAGKQRKVGLMGAAISDYPDIDALCNLLLDRKMPMSVASLRADSLRQPLVDALAASQQKTITLAPEAGSERMRKIINKTITDEDLLKAVALAVNAGILHVRLYIMIGLPGEEMSDIEAIVALARQLKQYMQECGSRGKLTLSINPFIPKPFTPFQWLPVAPMQEVERRLKWIVSQLRKEKGMEILAESPKEAYVQAVLARGDRRLATVLAAAVEQGGPKAFKTAMKQAGLSMENYLYRERSEAECLPWHILDMGLKEGYLEQEMRVAEAERFTAPCQPGCRRCGICRC